jgi:hypothetical protein
VPVTNLSGTLLALLVCANVPKARSLPKSGASESCFTLVGSGLTATIRVENLGKDKHSSFLQTLINYDCKKFYNILDQWPHSQHFIFFVAYE